MHKGACCINHSKFGCIFVEIGEFSCDVIDLLPWSYSWLASPSTCSLSSSVALIVWDKVNDLLSYMACVEKNKNHVFKLEVFASCSHVAITTTTHAFHENHG